MKSYEQFFIHEVEIYISKNYNRMGDWAIGKNEHASIEKRYCIMNANGVDFLPASLYESYMRHDCGAFQSYYIPTRKYIHNLDKTYFRFYDDAEEVLMNLIEFYKWAHRKMMELTKVEKFKGKIRVTLEELVRDVTPRQSFEGTRILMSGLPVRRRNELSPLALSLANERDLVGDMF